MISPAWLLSNSIITPQQNVWIAYSGGVDSSVMLDLARQCFNNVRAIHINHLSNKDDQQWQQHCETVCDELKIPLHCISVDAHPINGQSFEEAARLARRQAWQKVLQADDVLLVAHHADDQAETVLFRLLRGAGPQGLSGIKAISKVGDATIWRPLLEVSKQQILNYAIANKLNWLHDQSNNDDRHDRNYLRQHIMPKVLQRWPAAVKNINRAAQLCAAAEDFIAPQISKALLDLTQANNALNLIEFNKHSTQWQQRILRAWLQQHGLMPSSQHIRLIMQQVINARVDAMPEYVIGSKVLRRAQDQLFLLDPEQMPTQEYNIAWDLQQELKLPNGVVLNLADVSNDVAFIVKLQQHAVTIRVGNHGHKAKKIFQQHGIPPWERSKYPLLFANNRLAAIVGLWCSTRL